MQESKNNLLGVDVSSCKCVNNLDNGRVYYLPVGGDDEMQMRESAHLPLKIVTLTKVNHKLSI